MNEDPNVTETAQEPLVTPAEIPETPAPQTESEGEGLNPPVVEKPKKSGSDRRIEELLYERRLYQEERRQLLDLVKTRETQPQIQQTQPTQPQAGDQPNIANYSDYDAYNRDLAKWIARNEFQRLREEETKAEKARQFAAKQQQETHAKKQHEDFVANSWGKVASRGEEKFPDFWDKVGSIPNNLLSPLIVETFSTSPVGEEVAYYLSNNQDKLEKIARLSPIEQVRELTKLELKATKTQSNAPTPPTPVQGGKQSEGGPRSDDDESDWFKKRAADFYKERR